MPTSRKKHLKRNVCNEISRKNCLRTCSTYPGVRSNRHLGDCSMEIMMRRKTDTMIKSRKNKILAIFSCGTLILAFLFICLISYWAFYPYRLLDVKDKPIVEDAIVTQGQWTSYSFDYCKWSTAPVTVRKDFVDGIVYQMESPKTPLLTGCHSIVVPLHIPKNLPPGEYLVRIQGVYQVNPIRKIEVIIETTRFTVTRDESGAYGPTPTKSNLE